MIFSSLRHRLACMRGKHAGENFCAYCGVSLQSMTLFPFQVRSVDGQLDETVDAINSEHAKHRFKDRYKPTDLTTQRLPCI